MTDLKGTNISGIIVPYTTDDKFATHDSKYGKGGWKEVNTIAELNEISNDRLTIGMAVYVLSNNKVYIYKGIDTESGNKIWSEYHPIAESVDWGNITGTLSNQTDLQNKFNEVEKDISDLADLVDDNYDTLDNKIDTSVSILEKSIEDNVDDLQNQIDAHTQTLSSHDGRITTNANNISQEAINRTNADNTLQDQIDNLKARGRFLSLWNAQTGLAETNPETSPYKYNTGDYFIVSIVGETNYRPTGKEYVIGQASTVVETEELTTEDVYYFDGTNWHLQMNHGKTVSFANLAGQPDDNNALKNVLDSKQPVGDYATNTALTQGLATKQNKLTSANAGDGITISNEVITNSKPGEWGRIIGNISQQYDLQEALDAKQNELTTENAGDNINIEYEYINIFDKNNIIIANSLFEDDGSIESNSSYDIYKIDDIIDGKDYTLELTSELENDTVRIATFVNGQLNDLILSEEFPRGEFIVHFAMPHEVFDEVRISLNKSHTNVNILKGVIKISADLSSKQDVLTPGDGIKIENNVISNTRTTLGWGNITGTLSDQTDLKTALDEKQNIINDLSTIRYNAESGKSASDTISEYGDIVSHNAEEFQPAGDYATNTALTNGLAAKQNNLSAENAGDGISITVTDGKAVISNTRVSAEWGKITGTLSDQTDLKNVLDGKVDSVNTKTGTVVLTGEDINAEVSDLTNSVQWHLQSLNTKIQDIEAARFVDATIIGEPNILQGQVSGFSTVSYLQYPSILDLHDQAFQIDFCFTTATNVQTQQNILDSNFGIALAIANGKGLMAISSNGTSWNIGSAVGKIDIQSNTTYYARLTWNKLQYKTLLSTDGINYNEDMVLTGATRPYPRTIYIGGCDQLETGHAPHPFLGSINMNKASVTVMGNVIWKGMGDIGLATKADVSLDNLDALGQAKFDAKQDVISDLGEIRTNASTAKTTIETHIENSAIHVTENDKNIWNGKQNKLVPGAFITIDETTNTISSTSGQPTYDEENKRLVF